MKKVILNDCFGGFSFSALALAEYYKAKGIEAYLYEGDWTTSVYKLTDAEKNPRDFTFLKVFKGETFSTLDSKERFYDERNNKLRTDEVMISVVEKLGAKANGNCADLCVVEYDEDNYDFAIDEYDGSEDLRLIPVVNEDVISRCESTSEIMDYLESIQVRIRRCN